MVIRQTFILLLLLLQFTLFAQEEGKSYRRYFAKDQFSFSINGTQLIQETRVLSPSVFSRGVDLRMMYPVIGNNSNVAIAIGFGYAGQNYYLQEHISFNSDSLWVTPIPDSINYKKYKLSTNYLTVPVELRFRTNPNKVNRKSFKVYPGFRIGVLANVHTKYIGRDLETDEKIKEKEYNQKQITFVDYGPTFRIGYGKIMLHAYYSLTGLVEEGTGLSLTPYEVGISIILF